MYKDKLSITKLRQLFQFGNIGALQLFQLFRQGSGIIVAILLAQSSLPTEEIGVFEKLLYIGYTLSFFWISGLIQSMLAYFPKLSASSQSAFFVNAYLLFAGIAAVLLFLLLGFEETTLWVFTQDTGLEYFRLYAVYWAISLPTFLQEYFYLLKNQAGKILGYGVWTFGGHVIVVAGPILLGFPFATSFYGLIALATLKHLWMLGFLVRMGIWRLERLLINPWLVQAAPLMLYALMGGLNQVFDNWLVNFSFPGDEKVFAIFRYGARELPLAMSMASAFSMSLLPAVSEDLRVGLQQIKQKSIKLLHLLFPISIVLMLSSDYLFPLVFDASFRESAPIFNVYLLLLISRLTFPHTILIALKESKFMALVSAIELAINVFTSFLLVQFLGLWGIAMGSVIAYAAEKVFEAIYLYYKYGIHFRDYTPLGWYCSYSFLLLGAFVYVGAK